MCESQNSQLARAHTTANIARVVAGNPAGELATFIGAPTPYLIEVADRGEISAYDLDDQVLLTVTTWRSSVLERLTPDQAVAVARALLSSALFAAGEHP